MADSMKKNYKISGSGVLSIDGDMITICCEDKGEYNLAKVLSDLDDCAVKFTFWYEEEYTEDEEEEVEFEFDIPLEGEIKFDKETGKII
jgi:hypothetical protein